MANRVEITVQATDKGAKAVISGVSTEATKAKPALKAMSDSLDQVAQSAQTAAPGMAKVGKEVKESANDAGKASALFARLDAQLKETADEAAKVGPGLDKASGAANQTTPALGRLSGGLTGATGGLKSFASGASQAAQDALGMPPAISGMSASLGILGGALIAGVAIWMAWQNVQKQAKKQQEDFAGTLDDVTAAITQQTREVAAKKLQDKGMFDLADKMGISYTTLTDAVLGNKDALAEINAVGTKYIQTQRELHGGDTNLDDAGSKLINTTEDLAGSLTTAQEESLKLRDAIYGTSSAADAAAKYTDDMVTAINAYDDAVRKTTDPVFKLQDALKGVSDAQGKYNEAVSTYGTGSAEAAAAAWDLTNATSAAQAAANDGDLSFSAFNARLDDMFQKGLITSDQLAVMKDQAKGLADQTDRFADARVVQVRAELNVESVAKAQAAIDSLSRARSVQINPAVRSVAIPGGTMSARASGGVVGSAATGGARSGLTRVGEQGEELLDLPPGTQVHSNPDTERMTNQQGGGGVVQVVFGSDGSQLGDLILALVRNTVRVRGGNVQTVLGA